MDYDSVRLLIVRKWLKWIRPTPKTTNVITTDEDLRHTGHSGHRPNGGLTEVTIEQQFLELDTGVV